MQLAHRDNWVEFNPYFLELADGIHYMTIFNVTTAQPQLLVHIPAAVLHVARLRNSSRSSIRKELPPPSGVWKRILQFANTLIVKLKSLVVCV
jgi:hypothetical protein